MYIYIYTGFRVWGLRLVVSREHGNMVYKGYIRSSETKDLESGGKSPLYHFAIPAYGKISMASQTPIIGALVCVGVEVLLFLEGHMGIPSV